MNHGRKKVLLVCYGGGHIAMILPVMQALRRMSPDIQLVLMALTIGGKRARDAGEQPLGYADFGYLRDTNRVMQYGRRLLGNNASGDVSEAESLAYLGINYDELEQRLGTKEAASQYCEQGRAAFYPVSFMQDVVAEVAPDVVVTTNSPRSERAALDAAHVLGVPSVALNDLLAIQAREFIGRERWPDRICVLSQSVADYLYRSGAPDNSVSVTGNPAFDSMVLKPTRVAAEKVLETRSWEGLKPILFSGDIDFNKSGDARYTILYEIADVLETYVQARPDCALILRYHPSRWMDMRRPKPHPRIHFSVTPDEPPHPQILASSVVLAQYSTIALEASIAGKPVVTLEHLLDGTPTMSWEAEGVSVGCRNLDDLPGILDTTLENGPQEASPFKTDGQAATRVGETILSMTRH